MLVVAIIDLLPYTTLFRSQDYTIRAKMSEVILGMSACRTSITEVYQSGSSAPGANNWGCEVSAGSGSEWESARLKSAHGTITYAVQCINKTADGSHVSLTP